MSRYKYECICCGNRFNKPLLYQDECEVWGGYQRYTVDGCPLCGGSYTDTNEWEE